MIKVRAKSLKYATGAYAGYYGDKRIRPGEEFFIEDKKELGKWMEIVEEKAEKVEAVEPKKVSKKASRPKSLDVI